MTTFDVGGALLTEHEWQMSIKCVSDHTETRRFKTGEASAPSGGDSDEKCDLEDVCRFILKAVNWSGSAPLQVFNVDEHIVIWPLLTG